MASPYYFETLVSTHQPYMVSDDQEMNLDPVRRAILGADVF
jgi:hypothetical protein